MSSSGSDSDDDQAASRGTASGGGAGSGVDEVIIASTSLFAVQRQLHRTKHDLRNRLHSISYDAAFVSSLLPSFPAFPCYANLRQGAWYVDPALRKGTCCFKSSDGHAGQWCFNPRRLNKHVALAAAESGGVVLVDSTRGGKRLPDALSKTVPLWCAVLNTALLRHRARAGQATPQPEPEPEPEPEQGSEPEPGWDCSVHVAPIVPPSEAAQISDRIAGWADDLEASGAAQDLSALSASLRKPLRPLWFGADRGLAVIPEGYSRSLRDVPFTPVVCIMASETEHPKRGDFVYGQGAADDEEGWSAGLSAAQWWSHREKILAAASLEECQAAAKLAMDAPLVAAAAGGEGQDWAEICDGRGARLGVAVGRWEAGAAPTVWQSFGSVLNCGGPEHPGMGGAPDKDAESSPEERAGQEGGKVNGRYLWVDVSGGGKARGAAKSLTKALPVALDFARRALLAHAQASGASGKLALLLHCDGTEERSVALALAVLAHCFRLEACTADGSEPPPEPALALTLEQAAEDRGGSDGLSKVVLRQMLCRVLEARPGATTPHRGLLQAINRHFLSARRA